MNEHVEQDQIKTEGFPDDSDCKKSTSNMGELGLIPGWEDPQEEGMATHASILAWKIPWTEESGGVQSRGLQRVGHNRSTFTSLQIFQLPPNHPEKNFT